MAARTGAEIVAENPPLSQNRNPEFGQESEPMEMSQWLASQQSQMQALNNNRLAALRQKVQGGNDELANLIGN